jgi:hypothetical protein
MRAIFLLAMSAGAAAAADVADLARLFAGRFDSRVQWDMEDSADLQERDRHPWTTVAHVRAALPSLGPHVFYVEEYRDGKPAKIVRQRVVVFADTGETVRMAQYALRNGAALRGAGQAPDKLVALTEDQLEPMPGCDVEWRHDPADFWTGAIPGKTCPGSGGARPRYVQYRVVLTGPMYQRVDRELFVDNDGLAAGFADELPTVHQRITPMP